jgi:hypothetical protein
MARANGPVVVTDPLRPHTHGAQKLKAYDGPIPSYVAAMDAIALRGGLTIRRVRGVSAGELLSFYSGTREQIIGSGLLVNPDYVMWSNMKKSRHADVPLFSPQKYPWKCERANVYKLASPLYAVQVEVELPNSAPTRAKGVERFALGGRSKWDHEYVAYVGTQEALLSIGTRPTMFPTDQDSPGKERKIGIVIVEETQRLYGDLWAWRVHEAAAKAAIAKGNEERRAAELASLSDFATPSEYLRDLATTVRQSARSVLRTDGETKTKHGYRYRLTPSSMERAKSLIDDLYHDLRELSVSVARIDLRSDDDRRQAAAHVVRAETDSAFKAFMSSLMAQT